MAFVAEKLYCFSVGGGGSGVGMREGRREEGRKEGGKGRDKWRGEFHFWQTGSHVDCYDL